MKKSLQEPSTACQARRALIEFRGGKICAIFPIADSDAERDEIINALWSLLNFEPKRQAA